MGLFQHKHKHSSDDDFAAEEHFLDENFREELRNHARLYFDKVIKENGNLFKQDLDDTITQLNIGLKEHTAKQLDDAVVQISADLKAHVSEALDTQFTTFSEAAKAAQDATLASLQTSATGLEEQHKQLSATLQKSIANQSVMLESLFQENMAKIAAVKEANDAALASLNRSIEELQTQNDELTSSLEKKIATQEEAMIKAFEGNMAQVVEHYLLEALSDQYDLKTQLPSIIQQMEANKQAIVDDMKL